MKHKSKDLKLRAILYYYKSYCYKLKMLKFFIKLKNKIYSIIQQCLTNLQNNFLIKTSLPNVFKTILNYFKYKFKAFISYISKKKNKFITTLIETWIFQIHHIVTKGSIPMGTLVNISLPIFFYALSHFS